MLIEEDLREFEVEIRELYLEIEEDIVHPELPKLANTDGEPLVPTKMYFELSVSPREAFEALKTLAVGSKEEELLSEARYGEGDNLRAISFEWLRLGNKMHKGMENTSLGRIQIDGARLTVDVNSHASCRTRSAADAGCCTAPQRGAVARGRRGGRYRRRRGGRARTSRTGTSAPCATLFATLPSSHRLMPECPWVAMTTRSMSCVPAHLRIVSAGAPVSTATRRFSTRPSIR